MPNGEVTKCASCGYPISASFEGQRVACPLCETVNEAVSQGVTIPTSVFVGIVSFIGGMFLGPALIASTTEGKRWLEEQARGLGR